MDEALPQIERLGEWLSGHARAIALPVPCVFPEHHSQEYMPKQDIELASLQKQRRGQTMLICIVALQLSGRYI